MKKELLVTPEKCASLCTCGGKHPAPKALFCYGEDAYEILADDCAREAPESVFLLQDENTRKAAGEAVLYALKNRNVPVSVMTLPGDVSATEAIGEEVIEKSLGSPSIIAVGAGTVNDLGKYAAHSRGMPYRTVPTAPSMNGYTSSITAIKVAGVKRTLPAAPPAFIYANPEVIMNAPAKLRQSGFCDLLAKSVSDFDWLTESMLFSGSYCHLPSAIVAETESAYLSNPRGIREGDKTSVEGLFKGLLISGVAMSLAGSSAPASGGEHLVSHFLDMREVITGRKPELHGLQVGAGVVLSAFCYKLLSVPDEIRADMGGEEAFLKDAAGISPVWAHLSDEVTKHFYKKKEQLNKFRSLLPQRWGELKTIFKKVHPPEFFTEIIREAGFPMTLASLNVTEEEFLLSAMASRTIRERITVLDIAAHAGVLEEAARETVKLLS